jgi:hypothetical protein
MIAAAAASLPKEGSWNKPQWEVADIFRLHGGQYRTVRSLPLPHLKVMHSIEVCRTAYLGGHIEKCDSCGYEHPAYNSCRNRHCPKCQTLTKAKWLEDRKSELLPVGYFHTVFTLPHEINPVALCNQKIVFDVLFRAASETLLQFGKNNLGGKPGFLAILHTWEQTLLDHIHLHCVIAGGALSFDKSSWIPAGENYLFSVKALSKVFRGKFLDYLKREFITGELVFAGKASPLAEEKEFLQFIKTLKQKEWVVYCKKPFAGPEKVLDYIGRYTHRVALSNNRIVNVEDGKVTFTYRDRKNADVKKTMTLKAEEFIRRFLLHVLPQGFVRIRHFGFLANRCKKENVQKCRELIDILPAGKYDVQQSLERPDKTTQEIMLDLTGIDISICPCCKKGTLRIIREIVPLWKLKPHMDSS